MKLPPCLEIARDSRSQKKQCRIHWIILNSSIIERTITINHIISQIFSDNMWSIVILWLPCLPQSSEVPYPIEMSPIPKLRWRRPCLTQSGDENIRKPCLDIFGTSWWFQHVSTFVVNPSCVLWCGWWVISAELPSVHQDAVRQLQLLLLLLAWVSYQRDEFQGELDSEWLHPGKRLAVQQCSRVRSYEVGRRRHFHFRTRIND